MVIDNAEVSIVDDLGLGDTGHCYNTILGFDSHGRNSAVEAGNSVHNLVQHLHRRIGHLRLRLFQLSKRRIGVVVCLLLLVRGEEGLMGGLCSGDGF